MAQNAYEESTGFGMGPCGASRLRDGIEYGGLGSKGCVRASARFADEGGVDDCGYALQGCLRSSFESGHQLSRRQPHTSVKQYASPMSGSSTSNHP